MTLRGNILLLALLALLATTGGGYVFYYSVSDSARRSLVEHEGERQKDLAEELQYSFKQHQEAAAALAGVPDLQRALERPAATAIAATNGVLDHFNATLHTEACYLIGLDGVTVASSNRAAADSFVGQNYGFRPYFKEAAAGHPSIYAALGVTSGKRGLYFGHPVRGPGGRILGVVVLKDDIDEVIEKLTNLRNGPAFLADPQGLVFASNRPEFLMSALWELSPAAEARIRDSLQFGNGPFRWSGFRRSSDSQVMDPKGRPFEFKQKAVQGLDGWQLVYFLDPSLLQQDPALKTLGRVGAGVLVFCLFLAALTGAIYLRAIKELRLRQSLTEELRLASDQIQALVNASPLPIMLIGNDKRVQLWNPAAERVFGWKAEEVLGLPMPIVPPAKEAELENLRIQLLEGTSVAGFETVRMRKDGSQLEVAISTAPLKNAAGKIIGTMALLEDVSARKRAEQERTRSQSLQSIGILAGGIAHDFNNLLASVLAVVTLIKRIDLPREKMLQRLADAETSCKQARDLTARLLTFAPGGAPQRKSVDLAGLLRSTVEDSLRGSRVQARFDLVGLRAEVDEVQMLQVIQNLAKNALEAMPEGGTWTIEAVACELEQKNPLHLPVGRFARISLTDTGPGIPEQTLAQVFDPYFSTKKTFSDKGLGLGLTVCHSVVRRHGGAIQVESEIGKGTRFTIWLPLQEEGPQP